MTPLAERLLKKAKALGQPQAPATGRFAELVPAVEQLIKTGHILVEIQKFIGQEVPEYAYKPKTPEWWQLYHFIRRVNKRVAPENIRRKPRHKAEQPV